jgi:hypothetical protein
LQVFLDELGHEFIPVLPVSRIMRMYILTDLKLFDFKLDRSIHHLILCVFEAQQDVVPMRHLLPVGQEDLSMA